MAAIASPNRRGRRNGQSMVEFALTFTLILVLFFGILQFSLVIWAYSTVAYAARAGARWAIVHSSAGDTTQIDDIVKNNAVGLDRDSIQVTKSWSPDISRGSLFTIEVRYPLPLIASIVYIGEGAADSIVLSTESSYVVAY